MELLGLTDTIILMIRRTGTDPYDMYGVTTVADVQQYASIWSKLAARVTQAVQNFSVRRKAMQAQARGLLTFTVCSVKIRLYAG